MFDLFYFPTAVPYNPEKELKEEKEEKQRKLHEIDEARKNALETEGTVCACAPILCLFLFR